ncbi:MAG: hypothetical protein JWO60_1463, partial [Frankiales bacterium]|nr:hypothetical protein [Frankiales bacterium]
MRAPSSRRLSRRGVTVLALRLT